MKKIWNSGFTLIELVMVILLLSVLAAVAIPNFIDFRTDAKNAATQGAVGAMRSAISITVAAIQLKEDPASSPAAPKYPTIGEIWENAFKSQSHPVLSGTNLMDVSSGFPSNPWTVSTAAKTLQNTMLNCGSAKSNIGSTAGFVLRGWCYRETSGEVWANSNLNNGASGLTENAY